MDVPQRQVTEVAAREELQDRDKMIATLELVCAECCYSTEPSTINVVPSLVLPFIRVASDLVLR